jgi:SAM-dependent methyltransferase
MKFNDQFSRQSDVYAKARPTYPDALFEYLSGLCKGHDLAWDCATGNGQAALSLKKHFSGVVATDASAEQIRQARAAEGIRYYVATAYNSGLPDASVDLITVATAAHWFQLSDFYAEADRVLKKGGVLALWGYASCHVSPEVNEVIDHLVHSLLKNDWPEEYRIVENGYRDIVLPYSPLDTPRFTLTMSWDMEQLQNYMLSWSGSQRYLARTGRNPLEETGSLLQKAWGNREEKRSISWDLYLKAGRKS